MTTERQKAANRQNARRSTGPRSNEGKARSAKNATRHGLTARLLMDDILNWYRVILDDPETREDPEGPLQKAALELAVAETRLAVARQAHDDFLRGPDKESGYEQGKAVFGELVAEAMLNLQQEAEHDRQLIKAAARMHRRSIECNRHECEQQGRRLRRYLTTAEMRREAALRSFVKAAGRVYKNKQ